MKLAAILVLCFLGLGSVLDAQAGQVEEYGLYSAVQEHINEYPADPEGLHKAATLLGELVAINPQGVLTFVAMGRLTYKNGYISGDNFHPEALKKARAFFSEAMRSDPTFFDIYYYSVYLSLYEKNIEEAKRMAGLAAKLAPGSPRVDLAYAEIAKREGDFQEVERRAKVILQGTDERKLIHNAHVLLAWIYTKQKRDDLAEQEHLALTQMVPPSPWDKSSYSQFLTAHGRYEEGIEQGKQALALMDFGMGHHILSYAYYKKAADLLWKEKRPEEAKTYFTEALLHEPMNPDAHYGLGVVYLRFAHDEGNSEELNKAEQEFIKTIMLKPDHPQARDALNRLRQHRQPFNKKAYG
ncbi:MAG TPA: tetratricopeptide repeat protein [Nitrospira sp.]|nr:tetratricopeptide repeat protein [Nitrospira sp.]